MTFAIPFPTIDPVLFAIGPIVVRWYALAYIAGLLLGWRQLRRLVAGSPAVSAADPEGAAVDDFLVWATFAVVIGGRIGFVVFYQPSYYLANPELILAVWRGGMSFHGGLLGVIIATVWFCRRRGIPLMTFADLVAQVAPIGLFFGRIANFINGELWGRTTDVAWGVVFPRGGPQPRHPSQLYEALLEGLVLYLVLAWLGRQESVRARPGTVTGAFLIGYGCARGFVELYRQPDSYVGFLLFGSTMGQWLSLPMVLLGVGLIIHARRRAATDGA